MAVKIRLTRFGAPRKPTFRLVVTDSRAPRDGAYIESLGSYNPRTEPPTVQLNEERVLYWLSLGVHPTETAKELLKSQGVWQKYLEMKRGSRS
jgi:small subunit ribosomal protein S16